jgi:C1A family cysteine protease
MKSQSLIIIASAAIVAGTAFFLTQSTTAPVTGVSPLVKTAFVEWCQKYDKTYSTPQEQLHRMKIFAKNLELVKSLQQKAEGKGYTMGISKFMDITKEEWKIKYTGYRPTGEDSGKVNTALEGYRANPQKIDWRDPNSNPLGRNLVNPIKNQLQCGSCWAFSAVAAMETLWAIDGGLLMGLSEQQLVDCSTPFGNHGCNGGSMKAAFEYVIGNANVSMSGGMTDEDFYPYLGIDSFCTAQPAFFDMTIEEFDKIPKQNGQALENAVCEGVVSVAIDATDIIHYTSGVYGGECGLQLNHGVAVIGYGMDGTMPYWLVRNSWGTNWGEQGYFRLEKSNAKHIPGQCGILLDASQPQSAMPYFPSA